MMEIARLLLHGAVADEEVFDTLDCCLAEGFITLEEAEALALPLGIAYTPPAE